MNFIKTILILAPAIFFLQSSINSSTSKEEYVCLPCGRDCDKTVLSAPGNCSDCHMELVKKSTVTFSSVSPADLHQHILKAGNNNVVLLDVRTAEEFNGTAPDKFGRLKNAINIPVQQLKERIKELDAYKNKEIIVYCSHSHRSPEASYLLTQNGFKNVTNMEHGMYMWKELVTDKKSNAELYVNQQ